MARHDLAGGGLNSLKGQRENKTQICNHMEALLKKYIKIKTLVNYHKVKYRFKLKQKY